ncbi:unnamed protein product, partial [Mesorhabditis spiculigera]
MCIPPFPAASASLEYADEFVDVGAPDIPPDVLDELDIDLEELEELIRREEMREEQHLRMDRDFLVDLNAAGPPWDNFDRNAAFKFEDTPAEPLFGEEFFTDPEMPFSELVEYFSYSLERTYHIMNQLEEGMDRVTNELDRLIDT